MNVHVNGYNNNCSKKGFRGSKLSPYSIFQNNIMNRNKYQLNPNGNNPNSFICNRITYEENTKSNRLLNKYILTDMGATDGHQVDVDILEI
jgi:hypothetical protein